MTPGYFNSAQFYEDINKLNRRMASARLMSPTMVESCLQCSFAEFAGFLNDIIGSEPRPTAFGKAVPITHPDYMRSQRWLRAYRAAQRQPMAQVAARLLICVLDAYEEYVASISDPSAPRNAAS